MYSRIRNPKKYTRTAFTLAEVLFTLTVIGIVSSMTIPALLNNLSDADIKVKVKKTYSILNQALTRMLTDKSCNGDVDCTGTYYSGGNTYYTNISAPSQQGITVCNINNNNCVFGENLSKYFLLSKNCRQTQSLDCWAKDENDIDMDTLDFTPVWSGSPSPYYRFITTDGVAYAIGVDTWGNTDSPIEIYVDINGFKGPNRNDKDQQFFRVSRKAKINIGMSYPDSKNPLLD